MAARAFAAAAVRLVAPPAATALAHPTRSPTNWLASSLFLSGQVALEAASGFR